MKKTLLISLASSIAIFMACSDTNSTSAPENDKDISSSSQETVNDENSSSSARTENASSSSTKKEDLISSEASVSSAGSSQEETLISSSSEVIQESSESQGKASNYNPETGILTDERDGETYKTTKIGNQIWMAQNLRHTPTEPAEGCEATYLDPDEDSIDYSEYGRHYSWIAATYLPCEYFFKTALPQDESAHGRHFQGLCPKGWHLPTSEEWQTLISNAESIPALLSTKWDRLGVKGTDLYGFNVLPPQETENVVEYLIAEDAGNEVPIIDFSSAPGIRSAIAPKGIPSYYLRCLMD